MRHKRLKNHFGRKSGPRKALLRGLVISLVEHERIKTTLAKAKELRRHVEKAVTIGKKGDLASMRLLLSRYPNKATANKLIKDISSRFKERPGGYTRIIKLGVRPGDCAEMAFIEFVDYDFEKMNAKKLEKKTLKVRDSKGKIISKDFTPEEEKTYLQRQALRNAEKRKKHLRKISNESRRINFAKNK